MSTDAQGEDYCLLEIDDLSKTFKGLHAVEGYHLRLKQGEILGIIGPNGAGKSTVFNLLTGHLASTRGSIRFRGRDITGLRPNRIAALGIGRTFQNIRLFSSMTVLENVVSARQLRERSGLLPTLLSMPSFRRTEEKLVAEALEELGLFGLAERAGNAAVSLPYGDQRRLEIVRALASGPKLLLLDEPTAGMNEQESMRVLDLIRRIRDQYDLTIILVEHNMPLVMRLCDRIQVLNYGQIIAEGRPEQVRTDPKVVESYLGWDEENAEARIG
ncbi:MAG: ABC transporter ATP-binding protein [Rectinemataceae bacterium]|jgi:branched-chain amino acid transport system ATP-binding protein